MTGSVNIEVRNASYPDARLLSVLAATTFYEAYFEQDAPHDLATYIGESFDLDVIKSQLNDPDSTFLIVFLDEKAVGYARLIAGSRHPSIATNRTIELKRIYILERVWRKGVGEKLLEHCMAIARQFGNDSIWLGVWERNERARRFYEKQGFVKTGTLEFPYGDSVGINDVMEKML
jgi:diamine N-acetyltransferase